MAAETFTLEITPETYGSPNSANSCFQLTLDVGDCAPTFSAEYPGTALGVWTWPNSQQPWYQQPATTTGYYNPYCYNYGYYGSSQVPGSSGQNGTLQAAQTSPVPPAAPSLPIPAALQASQPANKQETKTKSPQKRVPTPHPRRPSAAAAFLSSSRSRPTSSIDAAAPTFNKESKSKDASKKVGTINYLQRSKPSLSERLNRLSLPSKSLTGGDGKRKSEIVGRPLWSGNFSGANSPAQTAVPYKPQPGVPSNLKGSDSAVDTRITSEKRAPTVENTAELPPRKSSSGEQPSAGSPKAPPQPQNPSSSPVVQYVNYNYRPFVVQSSPTCGNTVSDQVFLATATAAANASARFRTTSTLETICPSYD